MALSLKKLITKLPRLNCEDGLRESKGLPAYREESRCEKSLSQVLKS